MKTISCTLFPADNQYLDNEESIRIMLGQLGRIYSSCAVIKNVRIFRVS